MKTQSYALLSVFDKTGIVDLAKTLVSHGFKIISTGGTARILTDAGITVMPIQHITKNPESFDGRMKTISFQVGSGILYDRTNSSHTKQAKKLGISPIDIVVCNLYPFEQTISKKHVLSDAVESIDVGGPTMIRAAAKNFKNVCVLVNPNEYAMFSRLLASRKITDVYRRQLAAQAFAHLSFYDAQITTYLEKDPFPKNMTLPGRFTMQLRYGENPHQHAAVYITPNTNSPLANLQKLTGRDLSYINITDVAAGIESVRVFQTPAAVVIKHNNPSGIAIGDSSAEALKRAVSADPESAFGGVIILNKPLDEQTAKTFAAFKEEEGVLVDIVAAPTVTKKAEAFIKTIRKTTGIYTFGTIPKKRSETMHYRFFDGGFVTQNWDDTKPKSDTWTVATKKKPTKQQMEQMILAWQFIARIKSNTVIVVDKNLPMTRGIGSGQTSRVRATRISLEQAGKHAKNAIMASDSFFPFDDSVKLAVKHGISAIVQQGGSRNDQASIDAANKAGIVMVMTNERKFWH